MLLCCKGERLGIYMAIVLALADCNILPLYRNTCSWGKLVQVPPTTSISVQREYDMLIVFIS